TNQSSSSEEQALHDELVSLMHQESLAKAHNEDQRIAFEEEKRRISIAKGKEHVDSTFTLKILAKSPNDYTPTDTSQTSGGDEGLLDIYALNREVKRLKRQQIIKLKAKLKKL
ncbi:hypothetical protein Tco_0106790, partial [Tanacetum coccineum]